MQTIDLEKLWLKKLAELKEIAKELGAVPTHWGRREPLIKAIEVKMAEIEMAKSTNTIRIDTTARETTGENSHTEAIAIGTIIRAPYKNHARDERGIKTPETITKNGREYVVKNIQKDEGIIWINTIPRYPCLSEREIRGKIDLENETCEHTEFIRAYSFRKDEVLEIISNVDEKINGIKSNMMDTAGETSRENSHAEAIANSITSTSYDKETEGEDTLNAYYEAVGTLAGNLLKELGFKVNDDNDDDDDDDIINFINDEKQDDEEQNEEWEAPKYYSNDPDQLELPLIEEKPPPKINCIYCENPMELNYNDHQIEPLKCDRCNYYCF